jgi:MtN3 and saliva related transmembrane protein
MDVSLATLSRFAVRTFGLLLWMIYGYALDSLPVLIFSALGLVLSSVILFLKVRGWRLRPAGESCRQDGLEQKVSGAAEPITG